ncbi:hypothetical protein Q3G72_029889 [Acer saccharum]|nr:hypothetical protein Q3G72_029889 [Acer saccharum]
MASAPSKLYSDDVSLVVVLAFLNAILTLNQLNQVVIIATGCNSCDYVYDSSKTANQSFGNGRMPTLCATLLQNLEEFMTKDEKLGIEEAEERITSSLLSGSLSMALCCILVSILFFLFHFKSWFVSVALMGSIKENKKFFALMVLVSSWE